MPLSFLIVSLHPAGPTNSACNDTLSPARRQPSDLSRTTRAPVRRFDAQGGGQLDLMVLLLHEDLAQTLGNRIFSDSFALPDALAVVANRLGLVVKIEPQQFVCLVRHLDGTRHNRRRSSQVVDL